jgi:hypothetical protein
VEVEEEEGKREEFPVCAPTSVISISQYDFEELSDETKLRDKLQGRAAVPD